MREHHKTRIAIYMPSLAGGGSQINALRLAGWFVADGHDVDVVVHDNTGHTVDRVPAGVDVVTLPRATEPRTRLHMLWAARRDPGLFLASVFRSRKQLDQLLYLPALSSYLRRRRPTIVFSNLWQLAINLITARAIAAPRMPVVCIFRTAYFTECAHAMALSKRPRKWRRFLAYCRRVYTRADRLVTVSTGLATDLRDIVGVPADRLEVIYNPSAAPEVAKMATHPVAHPWFEDHAPPVILAVGRLSPEKRFDVLVTAFAELRATRPELRLLIVGDGSERDALLAQARSLGVADAFDLPGWSDNPYAYMKRSRVFVLCSRVEGLPTALIEALACGTPVVANDCAHGPREILDGGRFGRLVPLDDTPAMTRAIADTLADEIDAEALVARAARFSPRESAARYRALLAELTA